MGFRQRLRWGCLAAALVAVAPLARADVSAADKETARTLMDQGKALREAGDLQGALKRYTAADDIMHVPSTAYEMASTQLALGMLVEASDTFARILNMEARPHEPIQFVEARKKAQAQFDSLQTRIPTVTVKVEGGKPDDTVKLAIDGVEVPSASVGLARSVNPGHHTVVATTTNAAGRGEFDVAEGDKKDLSITLVATSRPQDSKPLLEIPPKTDAPLKKKEGGVRTAAWVSFGVGGAAAITGGVFGILTLSAHDDLANKCTNHVCAPTLAGEISDGNTFGLISTITFAVAGAALLVGIVTFALSGHKMPAVQSAWMTPGGVVARF